MTKIITELDLGSEFIIEDNKLHLNAELVQATLDGMPLRFNLQDGSGGYIELSTLYRLAGTSLYLLGGNAGYELTEITMPKLVHFSKSYEHSRYAEGMYDGETSTELSWLEGSAYIPQTGHSYFKASRNGMTFANLSIFYTTSSITIYDQDGGVLLLEVPLGDTSVEYLDFKSPVSVEWSKLTPMGVQTGSDQYYLRLQVEVTTDKVQFAVVDMDGDTLYNLKPDVSYDGWNGIYTNLFNVERGWAE